MGGFLFLLLRLSFFGSFLAGMLLILRTLLKGRVSQTVFYYLWIVVLFRFCVPVGITVSLPEVFSPDMQPASDHNTIFKDSLGSGQADALLGHVLEKEEQKTVRVTDKNGVVKPKTADSFSDNGFLPALHKPGLWVALWGFGAFLFLCRHLFGYLQYLRRIRYSAKEFSSKKLEAWGIAALLNSFGLSGRVRLVESPLVVSPVLVGAVHPVVVLPAGLEDPEVLRDILLHELTHAKRHDLLYKWFGAAIACLHWFNPLMFYIQKEIGQVCELSCDEAVIRDMDVKGRKHYGETLLSLPVDAPASRQMLSAPLCKEKARLKERIVGIVNYRKKGAVSILFSVFLVLAICGCALVSNAEAEVSKTDKAGDRPAHANSVADQPKTAKKDSMEIYYSILQGKTKFLFVPGNASNGFGPGNMVDIASVPGIFSPNSSYASIWRFTAVDLDGDKDEEVVLQVVDVAGDMGGYLVLHRQDDKVYGYTSNYRTFENLKPDGTYTYSNLTVTERGICRITKFTANGYVAEPVIFETTDDHWMSASYRKGSKKVTQEEYSLQKESQERKPDAVWHEFTEEGIAEVFASSSNLPIKSKPGQPASNSRVFYSFPVKVSKGKEVEVKLYTGQPIGETYCMVDKIQVYEKGKRLQTIEPASLPSVEKYAWDGLFVNQGYTVGEPDIRDLNFDGAEDFGLLAVGTYPHNVPYSYFLWNKEKQQFAYGFTLFGSELLEVDLEKQQLIESWHDVLGEYTDIYEYGQDGTLQQCE